MGLFRTIEPQDEPLAGRPLADRMRPQTLDEFVGQEELLGPGKPLLIQIERDDLSSMLLWGPPGCGKTTLARIIARRTKSEYVPFSAVLAGIKEIKEVMAKAEGVRRYGRRTIVFVDEMHRFNRAHFKSPRAVLAVKISRSAMKLSSASRFWQMAMRAPLTTPSRRWFLA